MKIHIGIACLLLSASSAFAPVQPGQTAPKQTPPKQAAQQKMDPAKEADIRRLLDLTGSAKLMNQMLATAEQQIRGTLSQALAGSENGQKIMDSFFRRFHTKFTAEMALERLVPIYDKYFSAEDLKALVQFYESPLGQRLVSVLPQVTRDSQLVGSELGQKAAQEAWKEVQDEFPELKTPAKPPEKP